MMRWHWMPQIQQIRFVGDKNIPIEFIIIVRFNQYVPASFSTMNAYVQVRVNGHTHWIGTSYRLRRTQSVSEFIK